jgi:DNA polymerase V
MLSEIVPAAGCQTDLFASQSVDSDSERLMTVLDAINRKMGKDSVKLASEGMRRPWQMKQGNKSPCFTTSWDEIVAAR